MWGDVLVEGDGTSVRIDEADGADDDSREGHSLGSGGRLEVLGRVNSLSHWNLSVSIPGAEA